MKGIIRSVIAWLKGNSFAVSSMLLHKIIIKKKPKRTTAASQLWPKPGRTVTIQLVCTLTLWDTNEIMPTGIVRVNLNSKIYSEKKSQGAHFLLVLSDMLVIFTNSNLAAWIPAGLQVLQHPPHFACSAFKQQQNSFTHELTKCLLTYSLKTEIKKKKNK